MIDRADLADLAAQAARQAGGVLADHHGRALAVATKSSDTDPVSEADHAAESVLVAFLTAARPADGLLAEEGSRQTSRSGLRWVVDPLDGTVNYLYGHVGWAVSVAVEEQRDDDWVAVAGVVYEPATNTEFRAWRGGGATMDGRPVAVNDPVAPAQALIGTGFSYDRALRGRQAALAARLLTQVRDIRRVGSAALDLCRVAAGSLDGYYESSLRRWDWAAGALIAREAGAVVSELRSGVRGHRGVLAAGPALHPTLARLVTS